MAITIVTNTVILYVCKYVSHLNVICTSFDCLYGLYNTKLTPSIINIITNVHPLTFSRSRLDATSSCSPFRIHRRQLPMYMLRPRTCNQSATRSVSHLANGRLTSLEQQQHNGYNDTLGNNDNARATLSRGNHSQFIQQQRII